MGISIDQNAQLAQFVRFADAAAGKDVARLSPVGLAGHEISATKSDSVHAFVRSRGDKKANDAVRDLFRKAVAGLFAPDEQMAVGMITSALPAAMEVVS